MDEHEHSPARMRYTKFVHYVQNYIQIANAPMLLFAGCQNSTALNSLHYSIRPRVEEKFVDVCGYDTRRAGLPGIAAGSSAGTVFTKTSSIQSMYPYLCTAVLGYSTLPWR